MVIFVPIDLTARRDISVAEHDQGRVFRDRNQNISDPQYTGQIAQV